MENLLKLVDYIFGLSTNITQPLCDLLFYMGVRNIHLYTSNFILCLLLLWWIVYLMQSGKFNIILKKLSFQLAASVLLLHLASTEVKQSIEYCYDADFKVIEHIYHRPISVYAINEFLLFSLFLVLIFMHVNNSIKKVNRKQSK